MLNSCSEWYATIRAEVLFRPAWCVEPKLGTTLFFVSWQLIKAAYIQIVIFDENDWLIRVKIHKETCQHLSYSRRKIDFLRWLSTFCNMHILFDLVNSSPKKRQSRFTPLPSLN